MAKKIKVQWAGGLVYEVEPVVWDICENVQRILLEQEAIPGRDPITKSIEWYAKEYKGGVGIEEAKKIVRKNSLFYFPIVKNGYAFVLKEVEAKGAGKRTKKDKGKQGTFNADFVYRMAEYHVKVSIKTNPEGSWAKYLERLKEKYPSKDRVTKRLGDRAQLNANIMKASLKAMEELGLELPKPAY